MTASNRQRAAEVRLTCLYFLLALLVVLTSFSCVSVPNSRNQNPGRTGRTNGNDHAKCVSVSASKRPVPAAACPYLAPDSGGESVVLCGGDVKVPTPDGSIFDGQFVETMASVEAFEIDATEITLADYRECVSVGACPAPDLGYDPQPPFDQCQWLFRANSVASARVPMNCVSQKEARSFCGWRGARLPTNAEWEFAFRGLEQRAFPWGDAPPTEKRANLCPTVACGGRPSAVGSHPEGVSIEGVHDLLGNVAEWVEGKVTGHAKLGFIRGGSFAGQGPRPNWIRVRNTGYYGPAVGFRCAQDRKSGISFRGNH